MKSFKEILNERLTEEKSNSLTLGEYIKQYKPKIVHKIVTPLLDGKPDVSKQKEIDIKPSIIEKDHLKNKFMPVPLSYSSNIIIAYATPRIINAKNNEWIVYSVSIKPDHTSI